MSYCVGLSEVDLGKFLRRKVMRRVVIPIFSSHSCFSRMFDSVVPHEAAVGVVTSKMIRCGHCLGGTLRAGRCFVVRELIVVR